MKLALSGPDGQFPFFKHEDDERRHALTPRRHRVRRLLPPSKGILRSTLGAQLTSSGDDDVRSQTTRWPPYRPPSVGGVSCVEKHIFSAARRWLRSAVAALATAIGL